MQCKICGRESSLLQNGTPYCIAQFHTGFVCSCEYGDVDKVKLNKNNQFVEFADSLTKEQQSIFWNILSSYTREQMYDGMKTYLPTLINKN